MSDDKNRIPQGIREVLFVLLTACYVGSWARRKERTNTVPNTLCQATGLVITPPPPRGGISAWKSETESETVHAYTDFLLVTLSPLKR